MRHQCTDGHGWHFRARFHKQKKGFARGILKFNSTCKVLSWDGVILCYNTGLGLAKRQPCRRWLEAFEDGKLNRSQQCTLAAVRVKLLLGCFSSGIDCELEKIIIPTVLEGLHRKLHSLQGHPAQEWHGQTGPGGPSSLLVAGGHDMYGKGAGGWRRGSQVEWYLPSTA